MPVNSEHYLYETMKYNYSLMRAIISGQLRNQKYIPDVDARDSRRNDRYRQRGVLVNFTKRTLDSNLGIIFKTPPQIKLPPLIKYLEDECTGNKLTLEQTAVELCREVLIAGRVGIFTDYPDAPLGIDQYREAQANLQSHMYIYKAEDIINWNTNVDNGEDRLCMVVLREIINTLDQSDGFKWKKTIQYRVLRIGDKEGEEDFGYYTVCVHDKEGNIVEQYAPKVNGQRMDWIPFRIAGAEINDINRVSPAPLLGLGELNVGHFRFFCDFAESAHICGQATLFYTSDLPQAIMLERNQNAPIRLGSHTAHYLGASGSAMMLQAKETSMATQGMQMIEAQAIMLGAALIQTHKGTAETAKTARLNKGSEVSVVETVVSNVEAALREALSDNAAYMNASPDVIGLELNHTFIEEGADPLLMAQINAGLINSVISLSLARDYWRKIDLIPDDMTNDQIDAEIEAQGPLIAPINAPAAAETLPNATQGEILPKGNKP